MQDFRITVLGIATLLEVSQLAEGMENVRKAAKEPV